MPSGSFYSNDLWQQRNYYSMHALNGMTKLVKYMKFIIFLSALSGFPKNM